jgi:predicted nucleic acid-binding protein
VLRAVLDANVYVSAYVRPEGPPGEILERFLRDAAFEVVLSDGIVDEVCTRSRTPRFGRRFVRRSTRLWFEDILVLAQLITGE